MKGLKKLLFATCLSTATLAATCLISEMNLHKASASENDSVATIYEYALLGETYKIQEGFQGGTTPRGGVISQTEKEVFLDWASGSYILNYGSYNVNLKVYETSPVDEIEYFGELTTAIAGYTYELPSAKVTAGIVRTDGAPTLADYTYSLEVSSDTEILGTFKQSQVAKCTAIKDLRI